MIKVRKSKIHNNGVFSKDRINKNTKIDFFEGFEIPKNTEHSLTLDGLRIEPTGVLKNLNHSCMPNAEFQGRWLVSLRAILSDEEITINYLKTEENITHHFTCNCGSTECRKQF